MKRPRRTDPLPSFSKVGPQFYPTSHDGGINFWNSMPHKRHCNDAMPEIDSRLIFRLVKGDQWDTLLN
jgi:hypothetical protein